MINDYHNCNQLHRLLYLPSYIAAGLLLLEMKAPQTWSMQNMNTMMKAVVMMMIMMVVLNAFAFVSLS